MKPKKALITAPTFEGYGEALSVVDCEIKYHYLDKENNFDLTERILDDIEADTDMVFICNPNNPTGRTVHHELIVKILKRCEETRCILVVDECFTEFLSDTGNHTMKGHLDSENLFIVKAFTKQFAMAGVRLGYGLTSNEKLTETTTKSGQAWGVSYMAQKAGVAALGEQRYLDELIKNTRVWKEKLLNVLKRDDIDIIGHSANYVFFRTDIDDLWEKLAKRGILIRSCANYHGLDENYYRIAVRSDNEIDALKRAMRSV